MVVMVIVETLRGGTQAPIVGYLATWSLDSGPPTGRCQTPSFLPLASSRSAKTHKSLPALQLKPQDSHQPLYDIRNIPAA